LKNGEIAEGETINVVVPTGNFGNILAAYYAKSMGLPIDKLICASNENKVLFDFFHTGIYNKNREFVLTSSPSMDILISSNLERLIYQLTGKNPEKTLSLMQALNTKGEYRITDEMKAKMKDFVGGYTSEEETAGMIKKLYDNTGYVIDTHTAVAASVYEKYVSLSGDKTKTIISSTASPYKFTRSVMKALGYNCADKSDFELIDALSKLSNTEIPKAIEEIRFACILHDRVCDKEKMQDMVENILLKR